MTRRIHGGRTGVTTQMDETTQREIVRKAWQSSADFTITLLVEAADRVTYLWSMQNHGLLRNVDGDPLDRVSAPNYDWKERWNRTFRISTSAMFSVDYFFSLMGGGIEEITLNN